MSFIGEAIATATIEVLLDRLVSTELLQFARRENIHADLKKWEKILLKIKAVLNDAAEKQLESQLVRDWLSELKNLAYDVEDILDEFATEALKRKLLDEPHASTSKAKKLIPSCFTGLSPRSIKFNAKMASQIKEITDRFEEIVEQKKFLELKEIPGEKPSRAGYQRPPATSVHEPYIYGRENDKEAILDMLFEDEGTSTSVGVPVISITGIGGLGKTTLAQLVYNDDKVVTHFDIKAWVCISEDFDIARVTKTILQSIASRTSDVLDDLNLLQVELKKTLDGKKFLIVLDDVWLETESYDIWTKLCLPFQAGSSGSKIVITTRNGSFASMVDNRSTYRLAELSNDDCLSLFTYHALGKRDFNEHQYLKEIGEKIVIRCKGLPLAAKTLGGLLRGSRFRFKDWEDLLDNKIWNLTEERSGILPALRVSYYYLPPQLKRCFAYCSIFPKDYAFEKKEIILLWIAEGFLFLQTDSKQAEDIGEDFFENLYSISFFQQLSSDPSTFVMHDLIHDLAQWAAEDFCFKVENTSEGKEKMKNSKNLRHLSFVDTESICECIEKLEASDEVIKSIRTFLPLPQFLQPPCDFLNLLPRLRRLRVLSLNRYSIKDLPNTISDLKHLRYLDLSYTEIEKLPDSINTLYNLEILILERCSWLVSLCSDMGNLINLRHLYISSIKTYPLERMPSRIGQLIRLRTWPFYLVGKDVGFGLKELKNLKHLQDKLWISGLENVNNIGDAKDADIIGKEKLRELELEWTGSFSDSRDIEFEMQVLDMLQPYHKLEMLTIKSYGGTKFPSWLAHTSLSRLVLLRFEDCKNCTSLPPIGQLPLLKDLSIIGLAGIKSIGPEFYGNGCSTPFESLENLSIRDMQEWKDWIHLGFGKDNVGFPRLRELSIQGCPKLSGNLPEHLLLLERLYIGECKQLLMFIPSLPKDCYINIFQCKEVLWTADRIAQNSEALFDISGGLTLAEYFLQDSTKLNRLKMVEYEKPTSFSQYETSSGEGLLRTTKNLVLFPLILEDTKELGLARRLQYLKLWNCECLMKLPQVLHGLSFLRGLSIEYCPKLVCIPDSALPSELKLIVIRNCKALKSLPKYWMQSNSLEELSIEDCDSLTDVSRVLQSPNLKKFTISDCPGIASFPEDGFPTNLTSLTIRDVNSCKTFFEWGLHRLTALKKLYIWKGCVDMISFPLPTSLTTLRIVDFPNLECLSPVLQNLSSLEELHLQRCPKLNFFLEKGLPPSLTTLHIDEFSNLEHLSPVFQDHTSLKELNLQSCPKLKFFPAKGLPPSLTTLYIGDFPNLERLSPDFQDLTSLKELSLIGCPNLKLLPEKGLPPSLQRLEIYGCPLLKQSCEKDKGLCWPIIALIPSVYIDCELVTALADEGTLHSV